MPGLTKCVGRGGEAESVPVARRDRGRRGVPRWASEGAGSGSQTDGCSRMAFGRYNVCYVLFVSSVAALGTCSATRLFMISLSTEGMSKLSGQEGKSGFNITLFTLTVRVRWPFPSHLYDANFFHSKSRPRCEIPYALTAERLNPRNSMNIPKEIKQKIREISSNSNSSSIPKDLLQVISRQ